MDVRKKLSKKEKIEIGIILGSVLIVAIVGISMQFVEKNRMEAIAGAAVQLNPDIPTYPGVLILMKDYCKPVTGSGSCDTLCGNDYCIPIDEDCDKSVSSNQCLCCSSP